MIALTWRQHRMQFVVGAAALLALAGYLVSGALQHASYAGSIGLLSCLAAHHTGCGALVQAFYNHFGPVPDAFQFLVVVPLLAGLFWGAPLVAREVETGTHRLAWTQSVSRHRWLTVKLVAFLAATVAGAVIVSLSFNWWLSVAEQLNNAAQSSLSRLQPPEFDLTGVAPIGTALFAFALGTAAGAVIRRTIPAMVVTVGLFLAVMIPLQSWRYRLFTPLTVAGPFGQTSPVQPGAYALSTGYADAARHPVTFDQILAVCGQRIGDNGEGVPLTCLTSHGFRLTQTYVPGSAYWPLQFIEAGAFTAVAVVLLAVAVWWTTRRIS